MKQSNDQLGKKIDALIEVVYKLALPAPIAPIAPVAPVLPIAPIASNSGDHDLLLRIDTKVERVIVDVAKINDNFANRIDALEREKISKADFDKQVADHEDRLRITEKFQENLMGKLSIMTAAISVGVTFIVSWIAKKIGL